MRRVLCVLILVLGATAVVAGCGGPTDTPTASQAPVSVTAGDVTAATPVPTALPPTEAADVGSRANPVPLGVAATVGDWDITVTGVNPDAAAIIAAENQFNAPPADGHTFVMIAASAKYTGEESGSVFGDLTYKVVGADGNSFSDSCGVTPDDITHTGETFSGATVTGNFCFSVETSQLDGATLSLEEFLGDSRTFFALQ